MREIKFRAWVKDRLRYTYNIQNEYDGCYETENIEQAFVRYLKSDKYIVEQFTGLLDKNGVEIYEGDVVKIVNNICEATKKTSSNVVVKFKDGSFIVTWDVEGDEHYNNFTSYNTPVVTFEVIGNIHEVT